MNQDAVTKLTDSELVQVIGWAQAEQIARKERRKQETIAKIKDLAKSIEVGVKIEGSRGRPAKAGKARPAR